MNVRCNIMRLRKILILLLLICSMESYAHSDFWKTKTFGNVKVRIKTGFIYEEINKCWIIGELALKLSRSLGYKDTVFLDFHHYYTEDCIPDYFLSFDDGSIIEGNYDEKSEPHLKRKSIIIREVSRSFDPCISLSLLEYAIKNRERIKTEQKLLRYDKNYCNWKVNTIDTALIRKVTYSPVSTMLQTILQSKVYRSKTEDMEGSEDLSYFYRDGKYHIYYKDYHSTSGQKKEPILLVTNNIYQFTTVTSFEAIVFETDDTFYFVEGVNSHYVSKRHIINNNGEYHPFEVNKIGWDKISINFCCVRSSKSDKLKDITLLLKITDDELLNLDKLLEKH